MARRIGLLLTAAAVTLLMIADHFALAGAGSIGSDAAPAMRMTANLVQATPTPQTTFKAATAPRITVTTPVVPLEEGPQGWRASGGDERSGLSVETTRMPSVCYSLRAMNPSAEDETVFFSADVSMAPLAPTRPS
jgi:hypothetical protein